MTKMTGVKEMRANLGQPGSIPKNVDHPMKKALAIRRRKRMVASTNQKKVGEIG